MVAIEIFNFLHFVGLAFGLGGATIATIISVKAGKDKDVGKAVMKIMPSISKLIWLGLILLIVSGVGISYFVNWPIDKQNLLIKHVLVAWIFVIGIFLMTRMKKIGKEKDEKKILKLRKQIKVLSIINLILWYVVTLLSAFV